MLILDVELAGLRRAVRITDGRIAAIGALTPEAGEQVVDGKGGALIPGLWDHHLHLNATAAARQSLACGPEHAQTRAALARLLLDAPGTGWLRAVGYHPGDDPPIDRAWLDRHGPDRPVRVQHRSGRMWILNSRACDRLGAGSPADGRLLDGDAWLRARLDTAPPDLTPVGQALAARGVVGLTEVTPRNGPGDLSRYRDARLPQRLRVMGRRSLDGRGAEVGEVKLHYHDHALPPLEALIDEIAGAHDAGRGVAAHCVTRAELFLTLAAIAAVGPRKGDRIEHAAVAPPEAVTMIADMGLTVVTQPHFLTERAAAYRREVAADDLPFLYRLGGWGDAGVQLAAGSDAPLGTLDPWASMAAAVDRPDGFGAAEALSPEQALALFIGRPDAPGLAREIAVGAVADMALLDRPWRAARRDLAGVGVAMTIVDGRIVYADKASISPQH